MAQIKHGSGRWATIVKDTGEVSSVAIMVGNVAPETRNATKDQFEVIEVDDYVQTGMVRGGDGFAWPAGEFRPSSVGTTRTADVAGVNVDKSRGNEAPKVEAKDEKPTPQPEDMKLKPAPSSPGTKPAPTTGHAPTAKPHVTQAAQERAK